MLVVSTATIFVYVLTWIVILCRSSSVDRKIMRCLSIVVFMLVVGHFHVSLSLILDIAAEIDSKEMLEHHLTNGLAINATISLNYAVYFVCSQEYRQAFVEQLKLIFCCTRTCKNSVNTDRKC